MTEDDDGATAGMDQSPPKERAQRAFRHAVDREYSALHTHESAAERHQSLANHYDQAAEGLDEESAERLHVLARAERLRAEHAMARADAVRRRLIQDGVLPENPGA